MEKKEFKQSFVKILKRHGFQKQKTWFYKDYDEIMIVVWLQKSDYADYYYIGYGYVIKAFNDSTDFSADISVDVGSRVVIVPEKYDRIEYREIEKEFFEESFDKAVREDILPKEGENIREWFIAQIPEYFMDHGNIKAYLQSLGRWVDPETNE